MSDTPRTEADFANMLNEAFGRGSIHAEMENSDYLSHHLKADEKMAAYREWRDAKARELAVVTAERDALQDAAATLIVRLPERMESILRGMHEDDVIPLHDAIEAVRAALRGKEGAK